MKPQCPTCKKLEEEKRILQETLGETFKQRDILSTKLNREEKTNTDEIARLKAELAKADVQVMKGKPRMEQVMIGCIHCGKSTPTLMPIQKCRHCNQFHESHIACIEHENMMNENKLYPPVDECPDCINWTQIGRAHV